jgi:hypothetical protein
LDGPRQLACFARSGHGLDGPAGDGSPAPGSCLAPGDPAFYATPAVVGSSVRTVNVSPTPTPSLAAAFAGAQPGDTIVLAAGTYTQASGNLSFTASGTSSHWITIQGAAGGAKPLIDLAGAGEFTLAGSYVLLDGVEIEHGGGNNLHVASSGASVQDVVVRDVGDHGIFFKGGSSDVLLEDNLVYGIHSNAAIQLGGITGSQFFDPAHPDVEGFAEVARNNLIADCDDAVFQVEGCDGARIEHNTVVSETGFAIFRLNQGSSSTGAASNDSNVTVVNNLVLATVPSMTDGTAGGTPQYARDDATSTAISIARELWGGAFMNSGSPGPGIPSFPQAGDVVVAGSALGKVVANPTPTGLTSMADALQRFALAGACKLNRGP